MMLSCQELQADRVKHAHFDVRSRSLTDLFTTSRSRLVDADQCCAFEVVDAITEVVDYVNGHGGFHVMGWFTHSGSVVAGETADETVE
jgi:hypothetical protein